MELLEKWYKPFMVATTVVGLVMGALVYRKIDEQNYQLNKQKQEQFILSEELKSLQMRADTVSKELGRLRDTHPYSAPKWKNKKTGLCTEGTFFGFLLYTPVDTTIAKEFAVVLEAYDGPPAKVNSVRRKCNKHSKHFHGKAIDLAWDEGVISFLLSEKGLQWLREHSLTMYIEGRPGSKRVQKYLSHPIGSEYVFFNESATGDHIHLNI